MLDLSEERVHRLLRRAVKEKGMKKEDIALRSGLCRATVYTYINRTPSSFLNAIKVCRLLGLEISDFYKEDLGEEE